MEVLETEDSKHINDSRQLEANHDAKERHWIRKLETLVPQGLHVADTFNSQNRSSRKKALILNLILSKTYVYIYIFVDVHVCVRIFICQTSILLFHLFFRSLLRF